jgi:hypothetical protein
VGYGYGVGFIKATSDIPIKILRVSVSGSGTIFAPYKIMGTTTNYQVPTGKTAIIALERTVTKGSTDVDFSLIGYADDSNGTNFVGFASLREMDIMTDGNERYWIFNVPSGKFIVFRYVASVGTSYTGIIVVFEV